MYICCRCRRGGGGGEGELYLNCGLAVVWLLVLAVCWFVACDCGISWSYSLAFYREIFTAICNYQLSKSIIHEIKFGDIVVI